LELMAGERAEATPAFAVRDAMLELVR